MKAPALLKISSQGRYDHFDIAPYIQINISIILINLPVVKEKFAFRKNLFRSPEQQKTAVCVCAQTAVYHQNFSFSWILTALICASTELTAVPPALVRRFTQ